MENLNTKSFFDLVAESISGKQISFSEFRGKVVLVVNTASACGYTPQYHGLQQLHDLYAKDGLVVLGFPSNDFGEQEPGSNKEIQEFCDLKYRAKFSMFSKAPVKGTPKQLVFRWLTEEANPALKGEVKWNFEKFLINRQGVLVQRFASAVEPEDKGLVDLILKLLAAK